RTDVPLNQRCSSAFVRAAECCRRSSSTVAAPRARVEARTKSPFMMAERNGPTKMFEGSRTGQVLVTNASESLGRAATGIDVIPAEPDAAGSMYLSPRRGSGAPSDRPSRRKSARHARVRHESPDRERGGTAL